MGNSDFFERLKPWSQRKHRLLGKYLPPFSAKVATTTPTREIFVVDGFAGAAIYNDGSQGSPLLIAQFSDVCAAWKDPVLLKLINVEPDKNNEGVFESLERATSEWVAKKRVLNIRSEFRSALPNILNMIGQAPALFFIDPFGPTHLFFDDLIPLLSRNQRITELIVNFDHDGLRRIVDAASSVNTDPKAAITNTSNISKIIGTDDWKRKIVGAGLTTEQAEEVLVDEYMNSIGRFGFKVVAYPVREVLKAKPKYYFVYCTHHKDGIALMNDFIREEEDDLYKNHVLNDLPLFSDEASSSNAIDGRRRLLSNILEDYLDGKRSVTRGKVRNDLIARHFGKFHSKDYNAVVGLFLAGGKLRETTGKKRINDTDLLEM